MPTQQRYMFFIDGENLAIRYQDMIKDGYVPQPGVSHLPDIYAWANNITVPITPETQIVRAYYYTSVYGDDIKIQSAASALKDIHIQATSGGAKTLYPVFFKKRRKDEKAKSVDISLTVDVLSHIHQNNIDTVCLFSGDGDFAPVLEEAIRYGKRVFVGALSKGLSPTLRGLADEYIYLDACFFDENKFRQTY
jgi:uncharacterized LabA/DUF88 family protein